MSVARLNLKVPLELTCSVSSEDTRLDQHQGAPMVLGHHDTGLVHSPSPICALVERKHLVGDHHELVGQRSL